jgi:hypothetical protein
VCDADGELDASSEDEAVMDLGKDLVRVSSECVCVTDTDQVSVMVVVIVQEASSEKLSVCDRCEDADSLIVMLRTHVPMVGVLDVEGVRLRVSDPVLANVAECAVMDGVSVLDSKPDEMLAVSDDVAVNVSENVPDGDHVPVETTLRVPLGVSVTDSECVVETVNETACVRD